MKSKWDWYLTAGLIAALAVLLLWCATRASAQTPPSVEYPLKFECTANVSANIKLLMQFDKDPIEAIHLLISNFQSTSPDKTSPVITSVKFTGNNNAIETVLLPNTTSVNFSVSATDDTNVTCAVLIVDDMRADANCWAPGLPAVFGMRFNANVITLGGHAFNLKIYDAAGNMASKDWRMTR